MLFKSQTPRPTKPVDYPAGVFVETEKGFFYIAGPGKRYRIITRRVLNSWSPPRIVQTTEAACANFKIVAKLKFRNGSLLRSVADGRLYFISEGKRRPLHSPEAFDKIGARYGESHVRVSFDEINLHEEGLPIT